MLETTLTPEQAMQRYTDAYRRLYKRAPREMRRLDEHWVVVNGSRIRVDELEYLTAQLERECGHEVEERRSIVNRLLKWFKS